MWPVLVALGALGAVAIWHWAWDISVLDYGRPTDTSFDVASATPGQTVHIRFNRVTWLHVCPSRLIQRVTCQQADPLDASKTVTARLDLEAHQIDVPPIAGRIDPKSRRFVVPPECRPGPLVFTSYAESECFPFGKWNLRYSYPPDLTLQVK